MTPAQTFIVLVVAILVDVWALGSPRLGNRLAFIGYLGGISAGFQGSGIFEGIGNTIQSGITGMATTYQWPILVGASETGIWVLGLLVLLVTVGALAPTSWGWLGHLRLLKFEDMGKSKRGSSEEKVKGSVKTGGGVMRRIFPDSVNVGAVLLAVLFISLAPIVPGGVGTMMKGSISLAQRASAMITVPISAVARQAAPNSPVNTQKS